MIVMDKEFKTDEIDESMVGGTSVADPELYAMLKDLRKHLARNWAFLPTLSSKTHR